MILALTTSTPFASIALVENNHVLAEISHDDPRGHAEHLFDMIDRAFVKASRKRSDVSLVACDVGPGSFTGVRIGVASAKGIAEGLRVRLAGVLSLEAMAAQARAECGSETLVLAAVDAKKGELYMAAFDGEAMLLAPVHLPRSETAARSRKLARSRPFVSIADVPDIDGFAPDAHRALIASPSAAWIGRVAAARDLDRVEDAGASDPAAIVPLYVRAPDAVPMVVRPPPAF